MGYLAVLAGSFLTTLVAVSMVLGFLTWTLTAAVPAWVLMAALIAAFFVAGLAVHAYEHMHGVRCVGGRR